MIKKILLALYCVPVFGASLPIQSQISFYVPRYGSASASLTTNSCGGFTLLFEDGTGTGAGAVTNGSHDATGAGVIVASVSSPNGDGGALTFNSIPANTWTLAGTTPSGVSGYTNQMYVCLNPTVSNGMVFYVSSGSGGSAAFTVQAFSTSGTPFYGGFVGNSASSGSSISPGSITVHGTNLYVTSLSFATASSINGPSGWSSPVSSGFGAPNQSYILTNSTQTPTWTMAPSTGLSSGMVMLGTTNCSSGSCGVTIAQGDTLNQDFSASSPSGWTSSGASTVTFAATNPTNIPCQLTNKVLHAQWSGTTFPYAYWDRGAYSCATYYFRFYFYVGTSSMGVNNGNIIDIFDADETTFGEGNDFRASLLQMGDSSTLGFFVQFAGGTSSTTNNISTGRWYRGEIQYVNSGAVAVKLYDASNSQLGTTWTGTSGNNKCFRFISTGVVLHNNTASADVYITGVGVNSTGFLGQ